MAAPSLKALAESKADGIQKATFFKVSPRIVEIEPGFNLREEGPELDEHIEQIAQAMKEGAYIPPIDVQVIDGRVIVRDGHCRTRAGLKLLAQGVDYQLEARQLRGNDADAVFHMLGSDKKKQFSPVAVGRGYLRLINMGQTVAQIAKRLGVSRATIDDGLALAEAPAAVHVMVGNGKVAPSTALIAIREEGTTKAVEALQAAVQTAQAAGREKAMPRDIKPKAPGAKELRAIVQELSQLQAAAPGPLAALILKARALLGHN